MAALHQNVERIMNKILQLKKNLTQLAILDATFEVFGSESHQYQLKPCLSKKDIQVFESSSLSRNN